MPGGKCIILIDGSNFYFKLKDLQLHHLLSFDFSGFVNMLAGENSIVSSTYYVGKIRTDGTEKTKTLFDNQQHLLSHLKNHTLRYALGYLLKTGDVYHEKGVGVNIAGICFRRPMKTAVIGSSWFHPIQIYFRLSIKPKQKERSLNTLGFPINPVLRWLPGATSPAFLRRMIYSPSSKADIKNPANAGWPCRRF